MSRRLALLAGSLIVVAAVGEVVLRLIGMFAPPPSPPVPRRPDLYHPDAELGYTLRPSTRTTYTYPVGSSRRLALVSNRDGFRSPREFDEPDPRPRVWVLGDSMVLGDGVAAEDRVTEVIESLEPGWRVDNLGMTGWGLDLMVRAYERLSQRVEPQVVLLAFYTDDFQRLRPAFAAQGYAFPKFEIDDGRLVSVPYTSLPAWRRLHFVQAFDQVYWRFRRNRYDLNGALLERLRQGAARHGRLAVAFVPGRGDTPEDRTRRSWLRAWCDAAGVPFVDLTSTIHGARVEDVYLRNNPHWNERGHRVAGEALHRFLRDEVRPGGPAVKARAPGGR